MSTESSTGLHGIEQDLDERLRGCLCGSRIEAGRATFGRRWSLGTKRGRGRAPLFEREFGRLFRGVKLTRTTSDAAVGLEEREKVLGRDTLLACKAQSVRPTSGVNVVGVTIFIMMLKG